jgi:GxxExxY protein
MDLNQIGTIILDAAFSVHRSLGPGLLESAYESCIISEMVERGLAVESQVPLPLFYKNKPIGIGYRADIKVNNAIIVEIKSVEALNDIDIAQMLTYLKISHCKLGYLINFNSLKLNNGIRRIIL